MFYKAVPERRLFFVMEEKLLSDIHVIRTGVLQVNTLIIPVIENKVFIVDPAGCYLSRDENKITDWLASKKLECIGVVLTHSHFDHITGISSLKKHFPKMKIAIHEAEFQEMQNNPGPMNTSVIHFFGAVELLDVVAAQPPADISLKNNDTLEKLLSGEENLKKWKVIHTPGHTPGSICLYNSEKNILISGDTLFDYGGYGRTDMEGGNESQIIHSLSMLKESIPQGAKVYPGHDSFGFSL